MVQSLTSGLSYMGSYLWGANTNNVVTVGSTQGEQAPIFTEDVKRQDIVKEGFLFKQSRYLKQWKR